MFKKFIQTQKSTRAFSTYGAKKFRTGMEVTTSFKV